MAVSSFESEQSFKDVTYDYSDLQEDSFEVIPFFSHLNP